MSRPPSRARALVALALLVPLQSAAVAVAVSGAPGEAPEWARPFYVASKTWLVVLPLVWHLAVDRRPASTSPTTGRDLLLGLAVGAVMCAVLVAARALVPEAWLDAEGLRTNLAGVGVETPGQFLLLAAGLTFGNAFLEELVWRWFVVEKCVELLPARARPLAVPLSALLFTAHHVVALVAHFDGPIAVLGSAGVFAAGWAWSALRARTGSIWPCYASHVLADACLMAMGHQLLFG